MIKNTNKITALTRRYEFFVLRRRMRFQLFCEQCAREEEFVALDDAVLFSGLATRAIVRLVEAGDLHYLETSGGHLFVCQQSLLIK
jgi:NAD kinase